MKSDSIAARLEALARSPFRARFHLKERDLLMIGEKGLPLIKQHALDLIGKRLAPAAPQNDGKQTPFRGHPVFIAQHATATCCRSCLSKWHQIEKKGELTEEERMYVVDVIEAWIKKEIPLSEF